MAIEEHYAITVTDESFIYYCGYAISKLSIGRR